MFKRFLSFFSFLVLFLKSSGFPDLGQWSKSYTSVSNVYFGVHKSLAAGSTVSLSVICEPSNPKETVRITIGWVLRQTSCFEEYYVESDMFDDAVLEVYYICPMNTNGFSSVRYIKSKEIEVECSSRILLKFPMNESFIPYMDNPKIGVPNNCEVYRPRMGTRLEEIVNGIPSAGRNPQDYKHDLPDVKPKYEKPKAAEVKDVRQKGLPKDDIPIAMAKRSVSGEQEDTAAVDVKNTSMPIDKLSKSFVTNSLKHGTQLAVVDMDGVFLCVIRIASVGEENINLTLAVTMKDDRGYLSAADHPLLWFYGVMCGVYVVYAFAWLVVSALQWRDLLRIQFWIGGVILLGLIEKAVFYAEYQSINSTGHSVQGAVLFAEILSCLKRTLARMLVIIVSLGFGIVKPRLGPTFQRVVGVGALYFFLGTLEGCLRVLKPKNDLSKQALIAGIPLAVTDSAICWWIFSSLVQTIRTLRLRRNLIKLSLYNHFTNTLIFAVLASVAFMVWSIKTHKLVTCITDWKELWVDEAYWHLLFSLLLAVIMFLWRPTQNNQRYAFTPLLDSMDDDNDDDFDPNLSNDAFVGMKMRASKSQPNISPGQNDIKNKQDEDLKWVEENIPSSLSEVALPSLLDSDEEIMTAKFERNKME